MLRSIGARHRLWNCELPSDNDEEGARVVQDWMGSQGVAETELRNVRLVMSRQPR